MADPMPAFTLRSEMPARRAPEVDTARIERAMREILFAIGEDPSREGLLDTPARVARAYKEMLAGLREDAGVHLSRQFDVEDEDGDIAPERPGDLVMARRIEFSSTCEHHFLPFTGVAHVAYRPAGGRVVGLSKMARTVDVFAAVLRCRSA